MIVTIIVIAICFVMFYGSYSISLSFYLKSLCHGNDNLMNVAITFDDGVNPSITPKVLDVLRKYNAKATFFIIGEKACRYPEIVKQIVNEGHAIGNHSYYHQSYFPMKSSTAIYKEIQQCNQILNSITGLNIMLFRPPFGVTNPMVGRAVRQSGLTSVGWSIRSRDTMGGDTTKICNHVTSKLKKGSIVLLHDNLEEADILLEAILIKIYEKGFKTVTINEFLN